MPGRDLTSAIGDGLALGVKSTVERLRAPEYRAQLVVTMLVSGWCGARGKRLIPSLVLAMLAGEAARWTVKQGTEAAGHLRTIAEAVSDGAGTVPPA